MMAVNPHGAAPIAPYPMVQDPSADALLGEIELLLDLDKSQECPSEDHFCEHPFFVSASNQSLVQLLARTRSLLEGRLGGISRQLERPDPAQVLLGASLLADVACLVLITRASQLVSQPWFRPWFLTAVNVGVFIFLGSKMVFWVVTDWEARWGTGRVFYAITGYKPRYRLLKEKTICLRVQMAVARAASLAMRRHAAVLGLWYNQENALTVANWLQNAQGPAPAA